MKFQALMVSAFVIATANTAAAQDEAPLSESCPNLTKEEIAGIDNYRGEFSESALYAKAYCVNVQEAERRMEIQLRGSIGPKTEPGPPPSAPSDGIGALQAQLRNEPTFAGLWIQHQPEYRVAVAFTRDAAATLARYTTDPLYLAIERAGPTEVELRAAQAAILEIFQQRGYRWAGAYSNETEGKVYVDLAQEAGPILAAAEAGEFFLPDFVVLKEPSPLRYDAPIAAPLGKVEVKAFPQLKYRTDMFMSTLVGVSPTAAQLELWDGCLVVVTNGVANVALWGAEVALDQSVPGKLSVFDRSSGNRVAAGEGISMMGLQPGIASARLEAEKTGEDAACPGPYRVIDGFQTQAAQDAQDFERDVQNIMQSESLPREAAERRYAVNLARADKLEVLQVQIARDHSNVFGGMRIERWAGKAHLLLLPESDFDALVPASLRPFVSTQPVPRSSAELSAAEADLNRQLSAVGVTADLIGEVLGGLLYIRNISDPRALSAAAVAGQVIFPAFARTDLGWSKAYDARGLSSDEVDRYYEQRPGFTQVREIVANTKVPSDPQPGSQERPLNLMSRARSLETATFLVSLGFDDATKLEALQFAGAGPIDAYARMNGLSTAATGAVLAEQVVIAEPVTIEMGERGDDGYFTTVRWKVLETLKGSAKPGHILPVRLMSHVDADGVIQQSNEEPVILPGLPGALDPVSTWLLQVSSHGYKRISLFNGGIDAAQDGAYAIWGHTAPIINGEIQPTIFYTEAVELAAFRSSVAPIQKAFVDAGALSAEPDEEFVE